MDRQSVLNYLAGLSECALAQLIHDTVQLKRVEHRYPNGDFQIDDALCLASCSFGSFKGQVDEGATIEVYAPPVNENAASKSHSLTEQGVCPKCRSLLISCSKTASCPICKTVVELT